MQISYRLNRIYLLSIEFVEAGMSHKNLKLIMVSSIILNLVFIAFFCGNYVQQCAWSKTPYYNTKLIERSNLTDDKKQLIKNAFSELSEFKKSKMEEIVKAKKDLQKILDAKEFDFKAYKTKTETIKKIRADISDKITSTVTNIASKLNGEERKIIAKILKKDKE